MGKAYAAELELLAGTCAWAMDLDIAQLADEIARASSSPLLVVGSGGSLSAAHMACLFHQTYAGRIAKAVTPLDVMSFDRRIVRDANVLMLSAGGGNPDIIAALQHVANQEPRRVSVICARPRSTLSEFAQRYDYVDTIEFELPCVRDGFLATNSLLAFSVLLWRAYAKNFLDAQLHTDIAGINEQPEGARTFTSDLERRCHALWDRDELVVLYGPSSQPAAVDIESKFSEAALGPVMLADYRNFAHGRHNWLAKRGTSSSVLCFVSIDDRDLADKTIRLLPSDVPVARLDFSLTGAQAAISALVSALYVVGLAGRARGIDPGRPSVPPFGRELYHLRALGSQVREHDGIQPREAAAIERKAGFAIRQLSKSGRIETWRGAYWTFLQRLQLAAFDAVVFDYDGTLCSDLERESGPCNEVIDQLERLLTAGIILGVATGRGKSAKMALRKLSPDLWSHVLIGYYNGADLGLLGDDDHPDLGDALSEEIKPVAEAMRANRTLALVAQCDYRRTQITVRPLRPIYEREVRHLVYQIVNNHALGRVGVVCSSHSLDVIDPSVSKRAVVDGVKAMVGTLDTATVLCIGDRGRWPGNDFALLAQPYALSADEVSGDPDTCWNLAPPGHRGVQATLGYLRAMFVEGAERAASARPTLRIAL